MMLVDRYVLWLAEVTLTCFVAGSTCGVSWEGKAVGHGEQCEYLLLGAFEFLMNLLWFTVENLII